MANGLVSLWHEMSFAARVFRVLIASPFDVTDERDIAVKTIQEWNDLHSAGRQVVLLPLRWETHSAPEYGVRPQEIINRQVVDYSDLLIGIFWTRIGSPTGADSGTLEEIERVASTGKTVMLYFSQIRQDPEQIELAQLQKLREFKKKTFPKALVEHYTSQIEFRDKLAKQLEIQVRTLIAEESQDEDQLRSSPITDIQLTFADPKTGVTVGTVLDLQSVALELKDFDKLPDYESYEEKSKRTNSEGILGLAGPVNKDYYRKTALYLQRQNFYRPVRFWLKNTGGVGARDVYVDFRIDAEAPDFRMSSIGDAQPSPPSEGGYTFWTTPAGLPEANIERVGDYWRASVELRALQPQREVSPPVLFVVEAAKSGTATITARIYADTLSQPITRKLTVNLNVSRASKLATDLVSETNATANLITAQARQRQYLIGS